MIHALDDTYIYRHLRARETLDKIDLAAKMMA